MSLEYCPLGEENHGTCKLVIAYNYISRLLLLIHVHINHVTCIKWLSKLVIISSKQWIYICLRYLYHNLLYVVQLVCNPCWLFFSATPAYEEVINTQPTRVDVYLPISVLQSPLRLSVMNTLSYIRHVNRITTIL